MVLEYVPGSNPLPASPPTTDPDPPLLYTVSAAAAHLGMSTRTLYRLMAAGEIDWLPGITSAAGDRRIERAELERYVTAQREKRDAQRELGRRLAGVRR